MPSIVFWRWIGSNDQSEHIQFDTQRFNYHIHGRTCEAIKSKWANSFKSVVGLLSFLEKTIIVYVFRFTTSDYSFDIFKLLLGEYAPWRNIWMQTYTTSVSVTGKKTERGI